MKEITSVFQLEVRYDHILNFTQFSRKFFSPFVKLSSEVKFSNIGELDERIIFVFDDLNYVINVSWTTIIIKGQGNLDVFLEKNSPVDSPFIDMLNKLMGLEEFGSIKNVLFASNHIKELSLSKEDIMSSFFTNSLHSKNSNILQNIDDIAISLDNKFQDNGDLVSLTYGPYFGEYEVERRKIKPLNISSLGDLNFSGVMIEYKHLLNTNSFNKQTFKDMIDYSRISINKTWEIFQ